MSTSAQHAAHAVRITRTVKKLEKPRPLNRHSTIETRLGTVEEIMTLADTVAMHLSNGNYDRTLQANIMSLNSMLKMYGTKLEVIYKDQLDRVFVTFRNGCRDENLDYISRLYLLELIEIRATQWASLENNNYYKQKLSHTDFDIMSVSSMDSSVNNVNIFQNAPTTPVSPVAPPQQLLLGPGELVKASGKFLAPTKIAGKNYCKDEVVIRNSDSGKVMGIKGRRVHMIEELSETVISFQRVNPGAKERLVQITGPTEEKIIYAKQLMEETIRRNASPVRAELPDKERLGSSSSLNSSTSDDSLRYQNSGSKRTTLLHSFSTSDATLGEYKYTVTVGDESLKITGTNLDIVRVAKLVLDEYFSPEMVGEYSMDEENEIFETVGPEPTIRTNSQESEESEDTVKGQLPKAGGLSKSSSLKSKSSFATSTDLIETDDVIFPDVPPITPDELKALEALEAAAGKRKLTRPGPTGAVTANIITYTFEELLKFADSPLSRKPIDDLVKSGKFQSIIKKPPIEWFDSKVYSKKRLQEADALRAIQAMPESGSPDNE